MITVQLIAGVVAIIGGVCAFLYFLITVFLQKRFQRLTATLSLEPVGKLYQVRCAIKNDADVRINLKWITCSVNDVDYSFEKNLTQAPLLRLPFLKEKRVYSIDASSSATFSTKEFLLVDCDKVNVKVRFQPMWTGDIYDPEKTFTI